MVSIKGAEKGDGRGEFLNMGRLVEITTPEAFWFRCIMIRNP